MSSRPIILIVDDLEDNRLILKRAFKEFKNDFELMEATDGEAAFLAVQKHHPALVIMDLMMPGVDGFEAIRLIRNDPNIPQMPILVLTALDSTEDKLHALELGATDFISKPYDMTDLKARVRALTNYHLMLMEKEAALREANATLESKIEAKRNELRNIYHTDPLTSLPNRNKLIHDMEVGTVRSLMIIDVDAFSDIVNFYGARLADELLIQIGMRLARLCLIDHNCYDLYRLGGDIFAVSLENDQACLLAGTIQQNIKSAPFTVFDDYVIDLFVTIGAADGGENLLYKAETALKAAKLGKEDFRLYDNTVNLARQYENNLLWTKKIITAIEDDAIIPHFQPIVNLKSGRIEKYESLIRLVDEEGTVHSPARFLDVARRSKLYPQLTCIMVKKSFEAFRDKPAQFSINISSEDITNEIVVKEICDNLAAFPHTDRVVFELLESDGIKNYDAVIAFIEHVKSHGCKIALDDFGSGYSNFSHILKLNVDYIKIDGSLIRDIHNDPHARAVVETIIDFSKKLHFETIAEFVHSQEVLDAVTALGVDFVQGYHCGEPSETI